MQDLHRDAAARLMHPVSHDALVGDVFRREQPRRTGKDAALAVRRHAARDHQPDAAARPRRIEFGNAVPILRLLQIGVHGPHQHPVGKGHMPEIKRRKQMRIARHFGPPLVAAKLARGAAAGHALRGVTVAPPQLSPSAQWRRKALFSRSSSALISSISARMSWSSVAPARILK